MLLIEKLQKQKNALEANADYFQEMMPTLDELMPFVAGGGNEMFECPVFEVSNISEYLEAGPEIAPFYSEKLSVWDIHLAADVFPPHPRFWMECQTSGNVQLGQMWTTRKEASGWTARAISYASPSENSLAIPMHFAINLEIDETGKIVRCVIAEYPSRPEVPLQDEENFSKRMIFTCIAALGFLNMHKNSVTVQTNSPSRQVTRQAQRNGQRVPPTYKTILVRGIQQSRARGPKGPNVESTMSLHIVRGHMVRTTAAKPLFGKPWGVGTFWVPSHTKGDIRNGDLRKVPAKVKLSDELTKK